MNLLETEIGTCPRCNAELEVGIRINAWLENVTVVERDPINDSENHEVNLAECPAYEPDASRIPYSGDLTGFYKPTVREGEEWWLNGKVLFRGRPLTFMPLSEHDSPVSVESIEKVFARVAIEQTEPCSPANADTFRVLMKWESGSGSTRRSPVDICAHLWPGGAWRVKVADKAQNERGHSFAYFVGEKLMCVQMSIGE